MAEEVKEKLLEVEEVSQRIEALKKSVAEMADYVKIGDRRARLAALEAQRPLFAEALPMTLEEVFIGEMEAVGYDYSNILS